MIIEDIAHLVTFETLKKEGSGKKQEKIYNEWRICMVFAVKYTCQLN